MSVDFTTPSVAPACNSDMDWAALCAQLAAEFRALSRGDVIETVARARAATDLFGLDPVEQLRLAETIARNNMTIALGGADLARLDPEHHVRRRPPAD